MQDAARNKHPEKAFIRKIKKQKLSPESESSHAKSPLSKSSKLHSEFSPLSSLGRVETTPSHNDSPVTETEQQVEEQQEEQQAKPLEQKPQIPQPKFKYTTFPVRGFNILPTRNITSNFAKNDVTYFPGNKAGSEVIAPNVSFSFFYEKKKKKSLKKNGETPSSFIQDLERYVLV
jgi:actin-related protein 8